MDYAAILDGVRWGPVGLSALQTFVLYWLVLLGMRAVGRRVFGERGPQDFMLLMLVAEATNLGLTHEDAGFWGSVASALTIIGTGAIVERIPPLRQRLDSEPVQVVADGRILEDALKRCLMDKNDVEQAARHHGHRDISAYESMFVEGDGSISAIPYREPRNVPDKHHH